jgi:hypothetical protein
MDLMLNWLESSEIDEAADAISEIMFEFPLFFSAPQKQRLADILTGPWAQDVLMNLLAEPTDELPRFVRLLLAYADYSLNKLAETPNDPLTQKIMSKRNDLAPSQPLLTLNSLDAHPNAMPWIRRCG